MNKSYFNNVDSWNELGQSDKERDKRPLRAYCSSVRCHKGDLYSGCNGTVKEGLSTHLSFCPDCGQALYWQKYTPGKKESYQLSHAKQSKKRQTTGY